MSVRINQDGEPPQLAGKETGKVGAHASLGGCRAGCRRQGGKLIILPAMLTFDSTLQFINPFPK